MSETTKMPPIPNLDIISHEETLGTLIALNVHLCQLSLEEVDKLIKELDPNDNSFKEVLEALSNWETNNLKRLMHLFKRHLKGGDEIMPNEYGTVKWFNNEKGYGFIVNDYHQEDIFVHYSSINMDGYKSLRKGDLVSFMPFKTEKGYHAENVHLIIRKEEVR